MTRPYAVTFARQPAWFQVVVYWRSGDRYVVYREHAAHLAALLAPVEAWVVTAQPHWLPFGGYLTLETGPFTYRGMADAGGRTPTPMTVDRLRQWSPDVPWRAVVQLPNAQAAAHEVFAHLLNAGHRPESGYLNSGRRVPADPAVVGGPRVHPADLAAALKLRWEFLHWMYGTVDVPGRPAGWRFPWRPPSAEAGWDCEISPKTVATARGPAAGHVCLDCEPGSPTP